MKYIAHFGVSVRDGAKVGSGRYPLGSGDRPYQGEGRISKKKKNENTGWIVKRVKSAYNKFSDYQKKQRKELEDFKFRIEQTQKDRHPYNIRKTINDAKDFVGKITGKTERDKKERIEKWNKEHEEFVNNTLSYYQKNPKKQTKFLKDITDADASFENNNYYAHATKVIEDKVGDVYESKFKDPKLQALSDEVNELFVSRYKSDSIEKEYQRLNEKCEYETAKQAVKALGFKVTPENLDYVKWLYWR